MHRRLGLLLIVFLAAIATGCDPTSEEIGSATLHPCEGTRLEAEMAADPPRADLRDPSIERCEFLRSVAETSRDPDGLRARLAPVS